MPSGGGEKNVRCVVVKEGGIRLRGELQGRVSARDLNASVMVYLAYVIVFMILCLSNKFDAISTRRDWPTFVLLTFRYGIWLREYQG